MDPRVEDWESFEEFSMESEESSYGCPDSHCDHTVAGRLPVGFWLVLAFFCLCICLCLCYITKKRDQIENLEMLERQDQVIKTNQIAKMIISGTAFESLQLTVIQTRFHFVCISEYIVMRCNESCLPFNVYWLQIYSRRLCR